MRLWPDRAMTVHRARRQQAATVHEIVVSQCHVIAPVRRGTKAADTAAGKTLPMDHGAQVPGWKMTGQLRDNWIRQIRSHAGWPISLLVLAFGGGTLGLALAAGWAGLRYNDSPSMPTGVYVRTSSESNATPRKASTSAFA